MSSEQENRHFVFTITAGRTGSHFLAELLSANFPDAEVHDEQIGFNEYGYNTPDISHLASFNSQGNSKEIRRFWEQKFSRISANRSQVYVETSHVLAKAGLIENIDLLTGHGKVHLICLNREIEKSVISYERNLDFSNKTMWWAWYLDPEYPKNIILPNDELFKRMGRIGISLWYLCEMQARQAYYRQRLRLHTNPRLYDVHLKDLNDPQFVAKFFTDMNLPGLGFPIRIPSPKNATSPGQRIDPHLEAEIQKVVRQMQFDPEALAQDHIARGKGFTGSIEKSG